MKKLLLILTLSLALFSLAAKPVKNVIFLIGDGMGLNQVYAAALVKGAPLYMMQDTKTGLILTYSYDNGITDSAAGGTALATGVKTRNSMIGMGPDSLNVESLLHMAARNGKSTGVMSTSALTHATPASFVANQVSRGMQNEIALDFVKQGPDVFIGGGRRYFEEREDGVDLTEQLKSKGYEVVYDLEQAEASGSAKLAALLADDHLPDVISGREYLLPEALNIALERLSRNKKGFFLMVEGSKIDMRCHVRDIMGSVAETLEFDETVKVALDFARKNKNTLVIVTADHETGGLSVLQNAPYRKGEELIVHFSTGGHSGVPVPVYSYGPGSDNFTGVLENTYFKATLARLMKLKP